MFRALLPILWAVFLLPSSNIWRFDGLPFDTGPELIGFLLLVPLTAVSCCPLRRFFRHLIGHRSRAVPAAPLWRSVSWPSAARSRLWRRARNQGSSAATATRWRRRRQARCERSFSNPGSRCYAVTGSIV